MRLCIFVYQFLNHLLSRHLHYFRFSISLLSLINYLHRLIILTQFYGLYYGIFISNMTFIIHNDLLKLLVVEISIVIRLFLIVFEGLLTNGSSYLSILLWSYGVRKVSLLVLAVICIYFMHSAIVKIMIRSSSHKISLG